MAKVEMYYKPTCPFCKKAKMLLDSKSAHLDAYIDITQYPEKREEMISRANGRYTVPQIFINGESIGGSDDLHRLDAEGKLDALLAQE